MPSIPLEELDGWNVGLIVGPSGSGKSTIARQLWKGKLTTGFRWPRDRAVLDAFPDQAGIKEVVGALTAVGFGSPPAWLRPFHTLSTGEQFRATLARAIVSTPAEGITVIDEFTSTVDRQVAKVASHALAKAVRREGRKLIALSCHYDIAEWLQPDWTYQPHLGRFTKERLRRRPAVKLDIHPVARSVWPLFSHHHYLTGELHKGAQCFGGYVDGELVAFASYIHFPTQTSAWIKKGHRLVVLPDWQGLGIGGRMDDWLGEQLWQQGFEYRNTIAHPALIAYYSRSPRWRLLGRGTFAGGGGLGALRSGAWRSSQNSYRMRNRAFDTRLFATVTFAYVPEEALA